MKAINLRDSKLLLLASLMALLLPGIAGATPTLIGVLPATPGGTNYQAWYDPVANLTWLANANAAAGSSYDTFRPGSGQMQWSQAKDWAASLDIDGVTGWRLPTTAQPDSTCSVQNNGSQGVDCTGSEMGNLFYNVLGGTAYQGIQAHHNSNYDLFTNIGTQSYWSSTGYAPINGLAWYFDFGYYGSQGASTNTQGLYGWAVYTGKAGAPIAVPEPGTLGLFGLGLLLIGGGLGWGKRRRASGYRRLG